MIPVPSTATRVVDLTWACYARRNFRCPPELEESRGSAHQPEGSGRRRLRRRHVHEHHGCDDRQRRPAHHRPGLQRERHGGGRDLDRLPGQPGRVHPGVRLARRPLRRQAGAARGHRGVHRRLGAVRAGLQPGRAGRVPDPAGRGRRHARPGRDGDAVPGVPARRADPGLGHPHRAYHVRAGPRPGAGRPARHRPVVAVGVLRQRADRRGGVRLRRAVPASSRRRRSPGRFDLAGFLLSGLGLGLLMYGVSEGPNLGWHRPRGARPRSRPGRCCWPPWWPSSCGRARPWWTCGC